MSRVRALAVLVLLLSYGAVGARQPAVRTAVPLPAPAADIASALGLSSADHSRLLLDIVRLLYDAPVGQDAEDTRRRNAFLDLVSRPDAKTSELVPLPLDLSVWRETILRRPVQDTEIVRAIMTDRQVALLYVGLAALDDETLAWLGPDRETLEYLQRHAGAFAAFGRSLRIRANRIAVPGGTEQDGVWKSIVGADPAQPAAFVRKLFGGDRARTAYFYDAVAHLDPARQRFALAMALPEGRRLERVRALLDAFERGQADWFPPERPFMRPPLDAALILSQLRVTPDGQLQEPASRALWELVFRGDETVVVPFLAPGATGPTSAADAVAADAAWMVSRIVRFPGPVAQRRLHTVLFAQRVFTEATDVAPLEPALRAYMAYPALVLTLERMGITSPDLFTRAATQARTLDAIRDESVRGIATRQLQATIGILARAADAGALTPARAAIDTAALLAVPVSSDRGYEGRLGAWLRDSLLKSLPATADESPNPLDDAVLAAMAGMRADMPPAPIVEWEGRRYRVDPARGELLRLRRARERQGPPTLDDALSGPPPADNMLADALASILYAAYLGDPEGAPFQGGNVALRHTLGGLPWRIPVEEYTGGWRLVGSLLGLDVTLRQLALRRLDSATMPPEPRMSSNERQTAYLAAALMSPAKLTDAARDEIAAAIARGRARVEALGDDPQALERVAAEAGMSEWRREALAWTAMHDRARLLAQFSLVDLLWIGVPKPAILPALDAWGASPMVLSGCLCLEMPRPRPWEELAGRPAAGLLASRGADVSLAVAETLAALQLPASLAPGVVAFAMQDVIDQAQPGYLDDWPAFSRSARELSRERLEDYIAALTARGPLLPVATDDRRP